MTYIMLSIIVFSIIASPIGEAILKRRGSGRLYGLYYDLKRQWGYYMTYIIVSMISLTATSVAVQFQLLLDHTK